MEAWRSSTKPDPTSVRAVGSAQSESGEEAWSGGIDSGESGEGELRAADSTQLALEVVRRAPWRAGATSE